MRRQSKLGSLQSDRFELVAADLGICAQLCESIRIEEAKFWLAGCVFKYDFLGRIGEIGDQRASPALRAES